MLTPFTKPLAGKTFIDLFSGIGGFRLALESLGGTCVYSCDNDKFACETYKANFGDDPMGDITVVDASGVPNHDILCAGFPCVAFSIAGKKKGFADFYKGQSRGMLFFDAARIIKAKRPEAVLLENVKNLKTHDGGETYRVIRSTLESLGYRVWEQVLDAAGFGVAQHRERIFIVAFRNDIAPETFDFPTPSGVRKTLRDILDPAPVLAKYFVSEEALAGMKARKARNLAAGKGFGYEVRPLDAVAHTIVCGGMGRERNLIVDTRPRIAGDAAKPANVEGIRRLTPRECIRCQGFPDDFVLPVSDTQAYKQAGNAVAVPAVRAVAAAIAAALNSTVRSLPLAA